MKLFHAKLKAAAVHATFTLLVAVITAFVVFQIWFPGRLAEMLGGAELYKLVLLVEVGLGPLVSLVIYNPAKPRSELIRDYAIVALIQLSALGYGLYTVSISRPVFMVFVLDRIELVTSADLSDKDIADAAVGEYKKLPWFGPKEVCYQRPEDQDEINNILFSSLEGKDVHLLPRYYRKCETGEIASLAQPANELMRERATVQFELEQLEGKDFVWLPLVGNRQYWTAVFPNGDEKVVEYYNIDPYEP